jgi:integrase
MKPTTKDLFFDDAGESAFAEYSNWFEAWIAQARRVKRLRHRSSEDVYRSMWGGFVEWALSQDPVVQLLSISVADLTLFVNTRRGQADAGGDLTAGYTWRLLNLIDRVLRYAAVELQVPPNTAAGDLIDALPGVRSANDRESALPAYLPADEARTLVIFLSHVRPRGSGGGADHTWNELRNRASVGLQLGGGLTPGNVRALTLSCVKTTGGPLKGVPWKIAVPADGNTPEHETPIAQWAGQLLRYWMQVRDELQIPGTWLFPSTKTGKPWGKVPQYEASRQVLEDAGLDLVEGGSFRLRHTFAIRQLRRGKTPAQVAEWMGISNVVEMERYKRVLHTPVEVV